MAAWSFSSELQDLLSELKSHPPCKTLMPAAAPVEVQARTGACHHPRHQVIWPVVTTSHVTEERRGDH